MPRILIADDNSNIQKMVTLALEGAGIEVVSVSNGGAAIRALSDISPDLVLADVFMPVRSGYEVCDFIKHEPRFSHLPVVLLVGAFDPLDEAEAQRVSADGILKKPFIPPEPLINMVKTLLVKSLNERPEPVAVAVHHDGRTAQDAADQPSGRVREAVAPEIDEGPQEEDVVPTPGPDFSAHEETLAFGSLLEMPVMPDIASGRPEPPASPAPWEETTTAPEFATTPSVEEHLWDSPEEEDEDSESPRPCGVGEFAGAQLPELDQIPSVEPTVDESLQAPVAAEEGVGGTHSTNSSGGSELDLPAEVQAEFESDYTAYEAQTLELPAEIAATQRDNAAVEPAYPEFSLIPELAAEAPVVESEDKIEESQLGGAEPTGELTGEGPRPSVQAVGEAPAAWLGTVVPVFPGSESLWASPPAPETSEAKEPPKNDTGDGIPENQWLAEAEAASPVAPRPLASEETEAPMAEAMEAEVPSAVLEPVAAEVVADSSAAAAPAADAEPAAKRGAMDPELIEAVVTRIVERMQPKVIDVVTREILRPLVEALVRREISKAD